MMRHTEQPWKHAALGDYVDIQTGFPFKSQHYTDDPSGIRLLRGDNIVQGKLRWDGVKRWGFDDNESFEKYSLRAGDIVLAMDRPWIEAGLKYAWITEHDLPCLLVQRVSRLRGINGLLTPYIRYVIGHHSFTDYLKGIWTGVAVPHISESQIRAFHFLLPPTGVQERILRILSAYDDLIENNTRRISILEDMAQMIYREWFVNFRFPGHEKVKMAESEMGAIPEGWSCGSVARIVRLSRKGVNPEDSGDETFLHFSIPAFDQGRMPVLEQGSTIKSGKYLIAPGCILLSKLNPRIPRIWIPTFDSSHRAIASTEFLVLTPVIHNSRGYVYELLRSPEVQGQFIGLALGTSTSHQRVKPQDFANMAIYLPPEDLIARFCRIVDPMLDSILNMRRRIANLGTTRDFLLPKLISGEVSVESVEGISHPAGAAENML